MTVAVSRARSRPSLPRLAIAVAIALSATTGAAAAVAAPYAPAAASASTAQAHLDHHVRPDHSEAAQRVVRRVAADAPATVVNAGSPMAPSSKTGMEATLIPPEAHVPLGEKIANKLREHGLPDTLVVLLVSALPVVELRAGIPVGFVLGLPPLAVFSLAVVGNMLPIVPLLLLLRLRTVQVLAARVLDRARAKATALGTSGSRAKALALFVGVPLPGTGAWTGCLVAFILGMPLGQSLAALLAGVIMSGTIMTALCALGRLGAAIAGSALLGVGISSLMRSARPDAADEVEEVPLPAADASE